MCRRIVYLIIIVAAALNSSAQTEVAAVKKDCSDVACHGNMLSQEVVHHPVKNDCAKCHQSTGAEHPVKDVKGFALEKNVPDLCYKCHDEKNTMEHVHAPIQKGNCLECHNPHSSPESYLLKKYPASDLCRQCHKLESADKKVKHKPVSDGDCTKCHDAHQSETPKLLVKESPGLCLKCHKQQKEDSKLANVHPPFTNNCLNCHSHHSSTENKLINLTTKNLCLYCHDDMRKKLEQSAVVHGAATDKKACVNCHSPHASAQKNFLIAETKELCLSCHGKTIAVADRKVGNIVQTLQKSKSVHGAIDKVGCAGCHDPHASTHANLLNKSFPAGAYAKANKDNFALCFSCHKTEILEKQNTTATNFRNGDKNMHFVHISGDKGRNCNICHNPHGSPNDFLVNEQAPFGNWAMPMKFQKLENGGSCAPGCHTEKKYERNAVRTSLNH